MTLSRIDTNQIPEIVPPEGCIPFVVDGVRGYGGKSFYPTRIAFIPDTPAALTSARLWLRRARAAWAN